jgi:hypothetical protein
VLEWVKLAGIGPVSTVEELKTHYRKQGNYAQEWLKVQEWLYTEGLNFAVLAVGARELIYYLIDKEFSVIIVSHKSRLSAKNSLDLQGPARKWLNKALVNSGINLEKDVYFEETKEDKILRIAKESVTHFVDDLMEIYTDIMFPANINKFLVANTLTIAVIPSLIQVENLLEIKRYV